MYTSALMHVLKDHMHAYACTPVTLAHLFKGYVKLMQEIGHASNFVTVIGLLSMVYLV